MKTKNSCDQFLRISVPKGTKLLKNPYLKYHILTKVPSTRK